MVLKRLPEGRDSNGQLARCVGSPMILRALLRSLHGTIIGTWNALTGSNNEDLVHMPSITSLYSSDR